MARKTIVEEVKAGKVLVSDGAWGTTLMKLGLPSGACPELWCVDHPAEVQSIARSYADAGADMVETNSFGGSRFKLESFGLADRSAEINEAAARASRRAVGDDCWVIGSMGPTGKLLIMEEVTEDELYDAFKTQAEALEKGGADAACIETMSDTEEACLAIKAVRENTSLEIICTFSFDRTVRGDYRTMMGVSPAQALEAAVDAGADIVGTNCGNGLERMIDIVQEMRAANGSIPILVHANAGLPQNINGVDVFPDSPEDMASWAGKLVQAGANIIGGCCGTTPAHIRAIKEALTRAHSAG